MCLVSVIELPVENSSTIQLPFLLNFVYNKFIGNHVYEHNLYKTELLAVFLLSAFMFCLLRFVFAFGGGKGLVISLCRTYCGYFFWTLSNRWKCGVFKISFHFLITSLISLNDVVISHHLYGFHTHVPNCIAQGKLQKVVQSSLINIPLNWALCHLSEYGLQ